MACPLDPSDVYELVRLNLDTIRKNGTKFSMDKFFSDMYDKGLVIGGDEHAYAASVLQVVPKAINLVVSTEANEVLAEYLANNGLDLNALGKHIREFGKELEKGIANVLTYLEKGTPTQTTEQISKELSYQAQDRQQKRMAEEKGKFKKPIKSTVLLKSLNHTTGQEAKHRTLPKIRDEDNKSLEQARGIQRAEIMRNIPDLEMGFYMKFMRSILDDLRDNPRYNNDSRNIKFIRPGGGTTGLYYTAMAATNIPPGQYSSQDKAFLENGNATDNAAALANWKTKVVMVATDENGVILYFNVKRELTDENNGRIFYSPVKGVHRNENGSINYEKSGIENPNETVKKSLKKPYTKITLEEATKFTNDQAEERDQVTKHVLSTDNGALKGNKIIGHITGGSQGIITKTPKNEFEDLSKVTLSKGFDIQPVPGLKEVKNINLTLPGVHEEIPLTRKYITQEDIESWASLIVDDIYDKGKEPMSVHAKLALLRPMLLLSSDRLQLFADDTKNITVRYMGHDIYKSAGIAPEELAVKKEEAKKLIIKYLSHPFISKDAVPISREMTTKDGKDTPYAIYLKTGNRLFDKISDPRLAAKTRNQGKDFMLVEVKDPNGKLVLKWANFQTYNVISDQKMIEEFSLETDKNGKISIKKVPAIPYVNWIATKTLSNAVSYDDGGVRGIAPINPSLDFMLGAPSLGAAKGTIPNIDITVPTQEKTVSLAPLTDPALRKLEEIFKVKWNKNKFQKTFNLVATKAQIEDAKKWYSNHPMSKFIPFEVMFTIVNSSGVAQWTADGIVLFKGSDFSDLYHESWHGFTQLFLTKEQKKRLYKEAGSLQGSFTDYKGVTVAFNKASEEQLEEWLAEDFRKYMLSGGKKIPSGPARKSIFKRLWDILKSLFGGTSMKDVIASPLDNVHIHQLFEKMRIGDLSDFTFDISNRNFNILRKGIQGLDTDAAGNPMEAVNLDYTESKAISGLLDKIITKIAIVLEKRQGHFISEHHLMKEPSSQKIIYTLVLDEIRTMRTGVKSKLKLVNSFRGFDYGSEVGRPEDRAKNMTIADNIMNKPDKPIISDGESFNHAFNRIVPAISDIVANGKAHTVVVTHGSTFGLISLWNKEGNPSEFTQLQRNAYVKQAGTFKPGAHFIIQGKNGPIHIVRHGETIDNVTKTFGTPGGQLTDKGTKQAVEIGQLFKDIEIPEIIASPLERTIDTARLIMSQQEAAKQAPSKELVNVGESRNMYLLGYIENNFYPTKKDKKKGIVAYHRDHTRFLTAKDKAKLEGIDDDFDTSASVAKERSDPNRKGNTIPLDFFATPEIAVLMKTIFKSKNQADAYDRFGFLNYEEPMLVWNRVVKYLVGGNDRELLYNRMVVRRDNPNYPDAHIYKQLLERLGDRKSDKKIVNVIWMDFQASLDKIRTYLHQLTINKEINTKGVDIFDFAFGKTSGGHRRMKSQWQTDFPVLGRNKFMKKDINGIVYLDIAEVVKEFAAPKDKDSTVDTLDRLRSPEFLRVIGIDLSEQLEVETEIMKDSDNKYQIFHIYRWLNILIHQKEPILRADFLNQLYQERDNITDLPKISPEGKIIPGEKILRDKTGWEGRFTKLAELEAQHNTAAGFMVSTAENKTQYEFALHSTNTRQVNAINNSESEDDLFFRFPFMSYLKKDRNPLIRDSIIMASLFDPITEKRRKVNEKDKSTAVVELIWGNLSGVATTFNDIIHLSGSALADTDKATKFLGDLITFFQRGWAEGPRTSDRTTSYMSGVSKITKANGISPNTKHTGKYYIDPVKFLIDTGREERNIIFLSKISNELARINYLKALPVGSEERDALTEATDKNGKLIPYYIAGQKFTFFHDVLSPSTKDELMKMTDYDHDNPLFGQLQKENQDLLDKIIKDLDKYFDNRVKQFTETFNELGFDNSAHLENMQELLRSVGAGARQGHHISGDFTNPQYKKALFEAYLTNMWIHNYETFTIFYGDLAQYKSAESAIKRITGGPATGKGFLNDAASRAFINSMDGEENRLRPYMDSKWFPEGMFKPIHIRWTGIVQSAVLQDSVLNSIYFAEYTRVMYADSVKTMEDAKLSKKAIDEILAAEMKNYLGIKEGDGQGWITFDTYRILKKLMGSDEWTDEMETMYWKVIKGEKISAEAAEHFFPTMKLQEFGPLATALGIPLQSFHKMMLLPLIPGVVTGNLEIFHNKMVSQGIDYALFQSGSKLTSIGKNGELDLFYSNQEDRIAAFASDDYQFTPNPVYIEYLKDQVSIPDKYKRKVSFSTQLRRLITTGLMSDGVPVDFKPNVTTDEKRKAWKKTEVIGKDGKIDKEATDKARRKLSATYIKHSDFGKAAKYLTEIRKKQLNIDLSGTSDGAKVNLEKLIALAKSELERGEFGEHEVDFVEFNGILNKLQHDLSLSPAAADIERLIVGMVERRLIKQKVKGEPLNIVSGAGMESSDAVREIKLKKPSFTDLMRYGSNGLASYHIEREIDPKTIERQVTPVIIGAKFPKDQVKADFADKIIAVSHDPSSSTIKYADEFRKARGDNAVNADKYDMFDKVMISVPGRGRKNQEKDVELIKKHIKKAIYQGVRTFIADNKTNAISPHNVSGEGIIAEFLEEQGFERKERKNVGFWVKKPDTSKIQSVRVKIALQGDFQKLLKLVHPDGQPARTLLRLNEIIQAPGWYANDENRRMISFISPRIPGQSKASFDIVQVHEFLPKLAGAIIIGPPEWLAKKGIDFDGDKELTLMPSITIINGVPRLAGYDPIAVKKIWERLRDKALEVNFLKDEDGKIIRIVDTEMDELIETTIPDAYDGNYTEEEIIDILKEQGVKSYEDFALEYEAKFAENQLLLAMENILLDPAGFADLIRANGTFHYDKLTEEMEKFTQEYDARENVHGEKTDKISHTRVMEQLFNLDMHQAFGSGMAGLGIAAVDASTSPMFMDNGEPMSYTFMDKAGNREFARIQAIYMDSNTVTDDDGNEVISVSGLRNVKGYKMPEYQAQLISGYVDVAKDPWIFRLGISLDVLPTFAYLVGRAGVTKEMAVYLVNNPLVRAYVREQQLAQSQFGGPLNKAAEKPQYARNHARDVMLSDAKYGMTLRYTQPLLDALGKGAQTQLIGQKIIRNTKEIHFMKKEIYMYLRTRRADNPFTEGELLDTLKVFKEKGKKFGQRVEGEELVQPSQTDIDVLLHYFELEDQSSSLTKIKLATRFDAKKSGTMFMAMFRHIKAKQLEQNGRWRPEMVTNIMEDSVMGSYDISEFLAHHLAPLFELSNHPALNNHILKQIEDKKFEEVVEKTYRDMEETIDTMKSDFISYIYQDMLRGFSLDNIKEYKGYNTNTTTSITQIRYLKIGAFVHNDTMYIDKEKIKSDYNLITKPGLGLMPEYRELGLAPLHKNVFESMDEYAHFVIEREHLRSFTSIKDVKDTDEFKRNLERNEKIQKREEGETHAAFDERISILSYEEILRDKALDNIWNTWKVFKNDSSYAKQYQEFKNKYRDTDMADRFPVLDQIVFNQIGVKPGETQLERMDNLRLHDPRMTVDMRNMFHESLLNLMDPRVMKVADDKENMRISEFFRKMPFFNMLQSGMATDNMFAMGRIMPTEKTTVLFMESEMPKYITMLDEISSGKRGTAFIDNFAEMFAWNNRSSNYQYRDRYKQYTINSSNRATLGQTSVEPTILAVTKIISGGQTGGDIGGLEGAKAVGIETGGTAPPNWLSGDKNEKALLESFGLVEGVSDPKTYPKRTMKNVDDSDGTLATLWGTSVGTSKTIGYAQTGKWQHGTGKSSDKGHRPVLVITTKDVNEAAEQLLEFVIKNNIKTLNVAGHREVSHPGIAEFTKNVIIKAFTRWY